VLAAATAVLRGLNTGEGWLRAFAGGSLVLLLGGLRGGVRRRARLP